MKNNFKKPPLSQLEKEKLAENFINQTPADFYEKKETSVVEKRVLEKEDTQNLVVRLPMTVHANVKEISNITGMSMNAVCLNLLRPGAKNKLEELKK
jgi:hypothetical protein